LELALSGLIALGIRIHVMEPDKTGTATDRNRVDWPERRWRWCRRPAVCNSTAKSDAAVLILRVNGYARGARHLAIACSRHRSAPLL
jgi:hypothetical protein